MWGQELQADLQLGEREVSGARSKSVMRRSMLVAIVSMSLSFTVCSAARAASFYWYGENNSTCWQTGQPPAPSTGCDNVGAGYLNSSGHMIEGAVTGTLESTPSSGDYCNSYNIGDKLSYTDEIDESTWTGISPPVPYGNWQEGDPHKTVCQAIATTWGQEVRGAANSECTGSYNPCGMQHDVSFASQGLNDRPWSSAFGSPSLLVSVVADPQTATTRGGAWGYICLLLKQATTNHVLEYCIEEWRTGTGYNSFDVVGECTETKNYAVDESITQFAPGTQFATESPGSANTFVFNSNPAQRTFTAYLTEANLIAAINADNSTCHTGLSTTPSEYALIAVEQGMEGRGLSELGTHTESLQLRTEYTHYQLTPVAATQEVTGVRETEATLHGSANPEGSATEAYFEYGRTTSYGNRVPASTGWQVGAGNTSIPAYEALTGLQPGNAYHYRLVAKNSNGTSYGGDEIFRTLHSAASSWMVREPVSGSQWAYYRGSDGALWEAFSPNGASWTNSRVGGHVASGSVPTVVRDAVTGTRWVFYVESNHQLYNWMWTASGGWQQGGLGGTVAEGSSPCATRDARTGTLWVFYVESNHQLFNWMWTTSNGWQQGGLGGTVAAQSSPSAVRDVASGKQWVFYNGSGALYNWEWNGEKWVNGGLPGVAPAAGTSPSATREQGGSMWVFYNGTNAIYNTEWNGKEWVTGGLAGAVPATGTSPNAVRDPENGKQWVFYDTTTSALENWEWNGTKWVNGPIPGAQPANQVPAAIEDPSSGEVWAGYYGANFAIWQTRWNGSTWNNGEI